LPNVNLRQITMLKVYIIIHPFTHIVQLIKDVFDIRLSWKLTPTN